MPLAETAGAGSDSAPSAQRGGRFPQLMMPCRVFQERAVA